MTIQEAVLKQLQTLSPEDQQKVLHFAHSLQPQEGAGLQRKDPRGMFERRGVHITAEEIDEARREAWANFPRDFPQETTP
jgi:hypothetical protein